MSRRALWSPTAPAGAADGPAVRAPAAAPTAPPVAPGGALPARSTAPLPGGSAIAAQVKLARLADVLAEAAGILRELSQESLELRAETRLMSSVETTTTPARLLTAEDLAARLQVDARTIRRWRKAGKIPAGIELGNSVIRWPADQIESWLAGGSR